MQSTLGGIPFDEPLVRGTADPLASMNPYRDNLPNPNKATHNDH